MNRYPKPGATYTLREIHSILKLDDSPHLGFDHQGIRTVIQTSHVTDEELLAVPGLADTLWTYIRTTSEWIPSFVAVDHKAIAAFVDIEPMKAMFHDDPPNWWVTPKGHVREQYEFPESKD